MKRSDLRKLIREALLKEDELDLKAMNVLLHNAELLVSEINDIGTPLFTDPDRDSYSPLSVKSFNRNLDRLSTDVVSVRKKLRDLKKEFGA